MKVVKITKESKIPLIGNIAFGIIDRGSSLLQVRATSLCNMSCPFCSTDAGPNSKSHKTGYIVDVNYLVEELNKVIEKKEKVHINIDSVGEPSSYPDLVKLVELISKNPKVYFISMQSNGTYFTKEMVDSLEKAGLKRVNLSIHTTDPIQGKELMGSENYDLNKVLDMAKYINKSKIELLIAPVLLLGKNEEEIEKLIKLAKEIGCKIGIQKYEIYKYSRKMKGIKKETYFKFYERLKKLEKKYDIKLVYQAKDLEVEKTKKIDQPIEINEKINTEILEDGWFKDQKIVGYKNRAITINNSKKKKGDKVNLKVIQNKNNIYLAEEK